MILKDIWNSADAVAIRKSQFHSVLCHFNTENYSHSDENDSSQYVQVEVNNYIKDVSEPEDKEEKLVCLGIASLMQFIQQEFTGPAIDKAQVSKLIPKLTKADVVALLTIECDLNPCVHPNLLYIALVAFQIANELCSTSVVSKVWLLRALFIHQLMLEEPSAQLCTKIEALLNDLENCGSAYCEGLTLQLEAARIRLYYGYVDKAAQHIQLAAQKSGLSFSFSGAMGRRTRYQEFDVAQLVVMIKKVSTSSAEESVGQCVTSTQHAGPKQVPLEDDVRMEKIKFTDPNIAKDEELTSQQVAILLATLMHRKKALPEDELTVEESRTLVEKLVGAKGAWPVQLSILLLRSHLERSARRTVERAMLQVQAVHEETLNEDVPVAARLKDFFVSYLPTKREVELVLADLLISLGAVKSALDICLRLQQWELAIGCYNVLQLRHKAKELIELELAKEETPKLWCLLGDATDDVFFYEKAWKLSNERSARAQRHWGNFLYDRKDFKGSIEHFEKSLSINSLQANLWFRLGFAALHEERWDLSAKAYRRYCILEQDSFEAWNNLARCYCETNQKDRAWRALNEALKIDTTNWRIWDNYMRVSADVKEYTEVIRSYNQILTVKKGVHVDMKVLVLLYKALLNKADGKQSIRRSFIALLERLVQQPSKDEAELWTLLAEVYALDASADSLNKQKLSLIKAHSKTIMVPGWEAEEDARDRDIAVLENLIPFAERDPDFQKMFVLLAKPSVGAISRYLQDNTVAGTLRDAIRKWDFALQT